MSDQIQRKHDENRVRPEQNVDDALQREIDDALGGMSLEDIIEDGEHPTEKDQPTAAPVQPVRTAPGVKRGRVILISDDDVFVDMGGKSQGVLGKGQFEGQPLPAVGDVVEVIIQGYDRRDGVLLLSRLGAVMAAAWDTLEEGQNVEGRVTDHNKGGLELDINGIKVFMPVSHIDVYHVEDMAPYVNQRLRCQVIEIDRAERRVICSRRAYLEAEAAAARERLFETLQEGQIVEGVVKNIMPYGAFVDIGGADGLLHVKDMSFSRVEDPKTIVQPGQRIQVKVLKIDRETRKIGLGLKQVLPDPWDTVEQRYAVDTVVAGRVTRLVDFGAFVELEPGIEGLVPMGEMSFERRVGHPSEVTKVGETINIRVISIEKDRRRVGLSIKRVGDDPWMGAESRWPAGGSVAGTVKRITDFGAFVEVAKGVEGLVHVSELSEQRVRAVGDVVKVGDLVQAKVLNVDEQAHRMSLSIKALKASPDYTGEVTGEPQATAAAPKPPKRKRPLKGGLDYSRGTGQ